METPPDTNVSSLLSFSGQLTRPENDVCVATLGAGPGAQPDGESAPCGPPQNRVAICFRSKVISTSC